MWAKEKDFLFAKWFVHEPGRKSQSVCTKIGEAKDGMPRHAKVLKFSSILKMCARTLALAFAFIASIIFSSCKLDPSAKELITHVPVVIDLVSPPSYQMVGENYVTSPDVLDPFSGHFSGRVSGGHSEDTQTARLFAALPSSQNFLEASVASFEVVASNGARYTWSLRGAAIQRQYDRISLNIPNMPVGQATFNGLVFLNQNGIPNEDSYLPSSNSGTPFTGVWRNAGSNYGGSVPINILSNSTSTQVLDIQLVDGAQGVPRMAHSNLLVKFCYDNAGGASMTTDPTSGPLIKKAGSGAGCVAVFTGPNATAISAASLYARLKMAGAATEWDLTQTTTEYPYAFFAPGGPRVEVEIFCNSGTDCGMGTGYFPTGQVARSCAMNIPVDHLTAYVDGTDAIFIWMKKSGC